MACRKVSEEQLHGFLGALCRDREVFALVRAPGPRVPVTARAAPLVSDTVASPSDPLPQYNLVRADAWDPAVHTLGAYRPVEPLKSLFFRPREFLGVWAGVTDARDAANGVGRPQDSEPSSAPDRIVIGVKNCDLSSLKVHDYVFRDTEPADPSYTDARDRTVVVSCDCTDARETCFCPAVGEQPYAKEGFDINLAAVDGGCLAEAGSARGEELLERAAEGFPETTDGDAAARDELRESMTRRVRERAEAAGLKCGEDLRDAVRRTEDAPLWEEFAADCVECGACNFVCCTCHCFLLADGQAGNGAPARLKEWDACLYRNFATVAGGANPRGHRAERLYNRFDKKFNFFPEVLGAYACDGCGRCVEACTGKIDIRSVLRRACDAG